MQEETWRRVPSDPDLLASNLGRIMVIPWSPDQSRKSYGGMPTFGQWDGSRFIYPRKGHKTRKVHRLVCEAFHGLPKQGQVCMHLNENAADNRPENLAWGSQKENMNAPGYIAYCKSRTGENSPIIKGIAKRATAQAGLPF